MSPPSANGRPMPGRGRLLHSNPDTLVTPRGSWWSIYLPHDQHRKHHGHSAVMRRTTKRRAFMTTHPIVARETWLEARRDLLAAEKDLTHRSDQVAELRRKLPWVRVETPYVFEGPNGKASLPDLFAGRSQLLVQHFMLAPGWNEGCKSCSYMADHADSMTPHLAQRDVTFVAVSRAPYSEIERFRGRMGWCFNWVSSNANSFNHDFRVSFTPEELA